MKKGAMELSLSTIVTIVLLVIMLGVGIYIITLIRGGATEAIDSINDNVIKAIEDAFVDEDKTIAIYPTTRTIRIGQGDTGRGFAFSVKNKDIKSHSYTWEVKVDENYDIEEECGIGMADANFWIVQDTGSFKLASSQTIELPILVKYDIPESAPNCQIPYLLEINQDDSYYTGAQVYLDIR